MALAEVPRRGGEAGFSCVLLALLAVGRIMRAKKPSSAPPRVEARESDRFMAAVLGVSEAREGCFFAAGATAFGADLDTAEGLRATFCSTVSSPCLAADEAVGAVRWDGNRTGRVGDRGFGFLKLPGDVDVASLGAGAGVAVLVAAGFFASVAGALALAAVLAVVEAVVLEGLREPRLVFGAIGFMVSLGAAAFA